MHRTLVKITDCLAAAAPVAANLTLSDINALCGIAGALLGAAYLIWKWRRDARTPAAQPFPQTPAEKCNNYENASR